MNVDDEVRLLAQVPLFAGIDDAHLRILLYAAEQLHIPARSWLVRQGEEKPEAFLLLHGQAEAFLTEAPHDGATLGRGAFIGEGAMIAHLPHRMNVRANSELGALRFGHDLFARICREFPEFARQVMANYAARMADGLRDLQALFS